MDTVKKEGILYIGGFELPDKNAAAQRVIANGKIFKDLGYQVYFLGTDTGANARGAQKQQPQHFEGFEFYSTAYPAKLSDWYGYLFSTDSVLQLTNELPDIKFIIAYNYPAPALYRLRRICRSKGISILSDCTEWYVPTGGLVFKTIKGLDTYFRMKIIHPKLDGVIAISKYLFDYYHTLTKNVLLLPPLVDIRSSKWENADHDNGDELVLVYAGSPGKGSKDRIDIILKALAAIKTTHDIRFSLHIVGLSKQQYVDDFGQDNLDQLHADVVFKGRLSHLETLDEVKKADYAIFIREKNLVTTAGFPTKFVEALSCGTPVLSNIYSNVGDYLRDGENGYILDICSQDALVNTLVSALSQGKKKVGEMKAAIQRDQVFDYRNYMVVVQNFLAAVENSSSPQIMNTK